MLNNLKPNSAPSVDVLKLEPSAFQTIITENILLINKALQHSFIVPNFDLFIENITSIFEKVFIFCNVCLHFMKKWQLFVYILVQAKHWWTTFGLFTTIGIWRSWTMGHGRMYHWWAKIFFRRFRCSFYSPSSFPSPDLCYMSSWTRHVAHVQLPFCKQTADSFSKMYVLKPTVFMLPKM